MPSVTYVDCHGQATTLEVALGETVMRGALDHDLPGIVAECGGGLACATCHCYVDDAWAAAAGTPASQDERDMLDMAVAEVRPTSRLSCQIELTEALDGLVVHLPDRQY